MSIPSMKAAITTRVDPLQAEKLYSESRNLGSTLMCPAGAPNINYDEYYRPLGGSAKRTLLLNDASCSPFIYSVKQKLGHENTERPILGPCNPGDRKGGDFLYGNSRSTLPNNIYGDKNAHFTNVYSPHMKAADTVPLPNTDYERQTAKPLNMSHNALIQPNI